MLGRGDFMGRTFAEEFNAACTRLYNNNLEAETDRVHTETVRDKHHAFAGVDIPKPNPYHLVKLL